MAAVSQCVCICCPQGCICELVVDAKGTYTVNGNMCSRGTAYTISETTCPVRELTMTVPVAGCLEPLSVKTSQPIPKVMIAEATDCIRHLHLSAPVQMHEVVLKNVCDLGVDVVATKTVSR